MRRQKKTRLNKLNGFLHRITINAIKSMVPKAGIEPARSLNRQILSLLRLPISPLRHEVFCDV